MKNQSNFQGAEKEQAGIIDVRMYSERLDEISKDYGKVLDNLNLEYRKVDYYLQVGEITKVQGWILHISVIISQLPKLLEIVLPVLKQENVPFKIAANKNTASCFLDGVYGYERIGKVLCIYPSTDALALKLAQTLIKLTASFRGPKIPTNRFLGGAVYTRYGAFKPIVSQDANGIFGNYIYGSNQELIKDANSIPFSMPIGINWPFTSITADINDPQPASKLLNDSIRPVAIIKEDAKGNVIKGMYMKSWFRPKYCIIKEGIQNMYSDDYGRDIQDRLKWQFELHTDLAGTVPAPRVLDYFIVNGNAYLAMEFIKGESLEQRLLSIFNGTIWRQLPAVKRNTILNYLHQILVIIKKVHERGYVHRDLTPVNFLVNGKEQLIMIDLELMHKLKQEGASPPFMMGTPGYMSRQQENGDYPTIKDDIYGLGALMLVMFTGLKPALFDMKKHEALSERIDYFLGETTLSNLIASCLNDEPDLRPDLSVVIQCISQLGKGMNRLDSLPNAAAMKMENKLVKGIILQALECMVSRQMSNAEGIWYSPVHQTQPFIANADSAYSYYTGIYTGVAGPLYTIFSLQKAGCPVRNIYDQCHKANWNYLQKHGLSRISHLSTGLFFGTSGIALMLSRGLECGLLPDEGEIRSKIWECLERNPETLDLANGIAGQSLAIIQCLAFLPEDLAMSKLALFKETILQNQQNDGSWVMGATPEGKDVVMTGLAYGMAGIIISLLQLSTIDKDHRVKDAVVRALQWLQNNAQKKGTSIIWFASNIEKNIDLSLVNGVTGIALAFIKSFEIIQDPRYRQFAEKALVVHEPFLVSRTLNQAHGIAGIGEVYLEAARIFKNVEWQHRADWITGSLLRLSNLTEKNGIYWIADTVHSTADLMIGNSGIIYFLARYLEPEKYTFPLI